MPGFQSSKSLVYQNMKRVSFSPEIPAGKVARLSTNQKSPRDLCSTPNGIAATPQAIGNKQIVAIK